jgi:hypothetical protein
VRQETGGSPSRRARLENYSGVRVRLWVQGHRVVSVRRSLNQLKKGPDKSRSNDMRWPLLNQLQTLLLAKQHFESTNNSFAAQPQAVPVLGITLGLLLLLTDITPGLLLLLTGYLAGTALWGGSRGLPHPMHRLREHCCREQIC